MKILSHLFRFGFLRPARRSRSKAGSYWASQMVKAIEKAEVNAIYAQPDTQSKVPAGMNNARTYAASMPAVLMTSSTTLERGELMISQGSKRIETGNGWSCATFL